MIEKVIKEINSIALSIDKEVNLMELCGTHTYAVVKNGINELLPDNVKLKSGPGCPVCVTDQQDIDIIVHLAMSGIPIATYGDALRVPGSEMSLAEARAEGADVVAVYSIDEIVGAVSKLPLSKKKEMVFFGIGFETTTPASAWAIKNGLVVYSAHKRFVPAMAALLNDKRIKIDGFINPGHVSTIIGLEPYREFKFPQVVAGFEASDVLIAIKMLLTQIDQGQARVENQYTRLVNQEGNVRACELINEVFDTGDSSWRGLGVVKKSGLKIKKKFKEQDAEHIFKKEIANYLMNRKEKHTGCRCGDVLKGLIEPRQCPLFQKACTPDHPQGACMVSVEGACSIVNKFNKM